MNEERYPVAGWPPWVGLVVLTGIGILGFACVALLVLANQEFSWLDAKLPTLVDVGLGGVAVTAVVILGRSPYSGPMSRMSVPAIFFAGCGILLPTTAPRIQVFVLVFLSTFLIVFGCVAWILHNKKVAWWRR